MMANKKVLEILDSVKEYGLDDKCVRKIGITLCSVMDFAGNNVCLHILGYNNLELDEIAYNIIKNGMNYNKFVINMNELGYLDECNHIFNCSTDRSRYATLIDNIKKVDGDVSSEVISVIIRANNPSEFGYILEQLLHKKYIGAQSIIDRIKHIDDEIENVSVEHRYNRFKGFSYMLLCYDFSYNIQKTVIDKMISSKYSMIKDDGDITTMAGNIIRRRRYRRLHM